MKLDISKENCLRLARLEGDSEVGAGLLGGAADAPKPRSPEQVIHDSLQEWNTDQFVELDWNTKAAQAVMRDLQRAGFQIVQL